MQLLLVPKRYKMSGTMLMSSLKTWAAPQMFLSEIITLIFSMMLTVVARAQTRSILDSVSLANQSNTLLSGIKEVREEELLVVMMMTIS